MPTPHELFSSSFSFCRRHSRAVLTVVLVVYIPIDLLMEAIPVDEELTLQSFARFIRVAVLLETLIGVLCTMALAHLVLADREGRALSVRDAFWLAASRWRASVGTQILTNLLFLAGLLALVLPAIFVWFATLFTIPLVALRELSGMAAIKASWALIRSRWWAVCRMLLLIGLVGFGMMMVVFVPYAFLPDQYAINVVFSLAMDMISAFFTVVVVHWMLALEKADAARAELSPAAAMYPAV